MADGEPAQQHYLAEVSQRQPVAQPAEHHEGDDVARQRRSIEDTVAALVELLAAVPTPESTIALCRQVRSLGHRRRATAYAIHRNQLPPSGDPRKAGPAPPVAGTRCDRTLISNN